MEKKQMIDVDRLSSLHNVLLIHILSFLPSKEAARTCILSRGWRNSWTSLPNLHFDITKPDHMDFIDRLLARRTESDNINSFHLVCHDNWLGLTDRVGAWINYALQHNIKRLNLQLGPSTIAPFQFFDILMTNQSLESLEVHGTNVQPPVRTEPDSGCFSKLRVLHLYLRGNEIRDNWIGRLISGCPVLEDAVVCAPLSALDISAPKLKRLKVHGQLDCNVIKISCPRLEVFEIHLLGIRSFQANELVNLNPQTSVQEMLL